MYRRSVRIACFVIGALATAGLAYRAFQDESAFAAERQAAALSEQVVSATADLLLDLRASLHAYVAPGQGLPFWGRRAQDGIESLRERLTTLDAMVSTAGGSLKQSIDAVKQLEAAERRARTYVSRDEMQLAGDVIFTEVRDVLAAMTSDVQSIRGSLQRRHGSRQAVIQQEQLMLAGGALALWVAIALLFLPTAQPSAVQDPAQWRNHLKEALNRQAPVPESAAPQLLEAPLTPAAPAGVAISTVRTVSEICADLSALADAGALPAALARVGSLLDATGLIVWVASSDGSSLSPVATHGFDPRLVQRLGKVRRDGANLTAAALRENAPRVSAATESAPAALAVPMCGPTGPAGVLSVELKAGQAVDEAKVALAAIVAAQLATLTTPIAQPDTRDVSDIAQPPEAQSA